MCSTVAVGHSRPAGLQRTVSASSSNAVVRGELCGNSPRTLAPRPRLVLGQSAPDNPCAARVGEIEVFCKLYVKCSAARNIQPATRWGGKLVDYDPCWETSKGATSAGRGRVTLEEGAIQQAHRATVDLTRDATVESV